MPTTNHLILISGLTSLNLWCRADEAARRDAIERRGGHRSGVHDRRREFGEGTEDFRMRLQYCDEVVEYRSGMEVDIIRIVG